MATSDRQSSIGVFDVLVGAVNAVTTDPLMVGVQLVGNLLGIIPFIGNWFTQIANGIAVDMGYNTIDDTHTHQTSLAARAVYLVVGLVVVGIVVIIGLLLLVLPGIYAGVRLSLFPAAVMVDGKGPIHGLQESWERTKGHWWTVFGYQLVFLVPGLVLLVGVYAALYGLQSPTGVNLLPFQLIVAVFGAPIGALNAGGIAVMYHEFETTRDATGP